MDTDGPVKHSMAESKEDSVGVGFRVAVVGCGEHFLKSHYPFLKGQVTVVVEPSSKFSPAMLFGSGVVHRRSLEYALLNDHKLFEAVVICSPDAYHANQLSLCVHHGKHVFVEKPLATSNRELDTVVKPTLLEAQKRNLVVMCCHPRPYDPFLHAYLAKYPRTTHTPTKSLTLEFFYHRPSHPDKHLSLLHDHWSHEMDLLRVLLPSREVPKASEFTVNVCSPYRYEAEWFDPTEGWVDPTDGFRVTFRGTRVIDQSDYHELIIEDGRVACCKSGKVYQTDGKVVQLEPSSYDAMFETLWQTFQGRCVYGLRPHLYHRYMDHLLRCHHFPALP